MSYKKAGEVLPASLLQEIQHYIDGELLYIPKKPANKKEWGSQTTTRLELQ